MVFLVMTLQAVMVQWPFEQASYTPWCRSEQLSEGRGSPEHQHMSECPDSWRGGAASRGRNSRLEPQTTTAADRRLTTGTRWCPPSTQDGLGNMKRSQVTMNIKAFPHAGTFNTSVTDLFPPHLFKRGKKKINFKKPDLSGNTRYITA